MRLAEIPGLSGPSTVAVIHSSESVATLEAFFVARGIEARAVEAPDWVQIGTAYDGTDFVEPEPAPEPEPEPAPIYYLSAFDVVSWAGQQIEQAMADIPSQERLSWDTQVAEANAVLANAEAETNLIATQSAITGETPVELATKIKTKAAELAQFTGLIIGIRRNFLTAIAAGEQFEISDLDQALAVALGGE
jgi:hypothetical protein